MSEKIAEVIKSSRKIVIKIGSNTLALPDGTQNTEFMASFAAQCAELIKQGKQIILVSSGAQVAGVSTTKEWARKKDVHYRQALCSIGQVELMHQWRKAFQKQGLHIGQLLLTKDDFKNEHRSLNIRNTLFTLVDEGVGNHERHAGSNGLAALGQHGVQGLGLGNGTGKTVQQEAIHVLDALELRLDHAFHNLVGNQVSGFDEGFGLKAQRSAGGNLTAEEFTGGKVAELVALYHSACLGAFSCTGRAEENIVFHGE